jgi:hypothetical protein
VEEEAEPKPKPQNSKPEARNTKPSTINQKPGPSTVEDAQFAVENLKPNPQDVGEAEQKRRDAKMHI